MPAKKLNGRTLPINIVVKLGLSVVVVKPITVIRKLSDWKMKIVLGSIGGIIFKSSTCPLIGSSPNRNSIKKRILIRMGIKTMLPIFKTEKPGIDLSSLSETTFGRMEGKIKVI